MLNMDINIYVVSTEFIINRKAENDICESDRDKWNLWIVYW